MLKKLSLLLILILCIPLINCATMMGGTKQEITFLCNEEATIYINGEYIGVTPITYTIDKKTDTRNKWTTGEIGLTVEVGEWSEKYLLYPTTSVGGALSGVSAAVTLFIPLIIDTNNGAYWKYTENLNIEIIRKGI